MNNLIEYNNDPNFDQILNESKFETLTQLHF